MAVAIDTLRVGRKYFLRNYGEVARFEVIERTNENDFVIKDLLTLEKDRLSEFTKYGKGKDYDLFEIF